MVSNVIPLPKRKDKEHKENCLFVIRKKDGWVDYALGEVYFINDKPLGYAHEFVFLHLEPIRAREIDDPEVIRDLVRNKLKNMKYEIDEALKAVEKEIVTIDEEEDGQT